MFRVTQCFSEGPHHCLVPSLDRILVIYPLVHSSVTPVTLRSLYSPQLSLFDYPLHIHLECADVHENMNTTFTGRIKKGETEACAERELWGWGPAVLWADFYFPLLEELFCANLSPHHNILSWFLLTKFPHVLLSLPLRGKNQHGEGCFS